MAYIYGLFYEDESGEDVCFYIGKGNGRRKDVHFANCRLENDRNKHKTRKIKKLRRQGKEPYSKKLVEQLDDEIAYQLEKALLERDDVFKNVTNVVRGGRGVNHTEETRRKISEKMTGENNPFYGKDPTEHMSEEALRKQKERAAETLTGKSHSEEHKRKISKSLEGNTRAATMNEDQAREVLWLARNTDQTYKEIAKRYPVGEDMVGMIKRKKRWTDVTPKKP